MTKEELAKRLDGCESGKEVSEGIAQIAKDYGLVIVYGASDDLMELDGAIYDEVDCYEGGTFKITRDGLLPSFESLEGEDEEEYEKYFQNKATAKEIEAVWGDGDIYISWTYKTDIPHATFNVMEDGEVYCVGIVFSLDDL